MTSIRELFRPSKNGDAATILTLQRKVADLTLDLSDTEQAARQTFLEAETNPSKKSKADDAAQEINSKREQLSRAQGALAEAERIQVENAEIAAAADAETSWRKVDKLARARQDKGVEIDTLVLKLTDAYSELLQLGEDLYHAAPVRGAKQHNSLLSPANVEKSLRLYLFKKRFKWASNWPWSIDDIKPFSDAIKDGNAVILSHRPKKEAA